MTAAMTIINSTRHTVISRRSRHCLLAVELTARFASTDSGRAGNASGGGAFPSILFSALRIELNGILLQTCAVCSYWDIGILSYTIVKETLIIKSLAGEMPRNEQDPF